MALSSSGNTRVVSSAVNGLVLVLVGARAMRGPLQLGSLSMPRAAALYVCIMALAIRYLPAYHPFPRFGPANQVTTARAALVSLIAALIGEPETPLVGGTVAGLAGVVTALDGVDGWLARKTGMSSAFGARFDMEVDALLILVLSILAWEHGKADAWIVLAGLLRYLFVGAGWLTSWMREPLPPSRRRQAICVVQVAALLVVMLPAVQPPVSVWIAAASLATLLASFGTDIRWLLQHRVRRDVPVPSSGSNA